MSIHQPSRAQGSSLHGSKNKCIAIFSKRADCPTLVEGNISNCSPYMVSGLQGGIIYPYTEIVRYRNLIP